MTRRLSRTIVWHQGRSFATATSRSSKMRLLYLFSQRFPSRNPLDVVPGYQSPFWGYRLYIIIIMRFATLAGLFFSALAVSAQSSLSDPTTSELLGELAKLPTCAVRTRTPKGFIIHPRHKANNHYRPHVWHHHCPCRVVPLVTSTACVPTRST
jgi:hypothetical protein